ncbi:hypothetical protein [uncultured Tissierella sp.]|jgi:NRPS condensation-like uncharacterized protein|uniref:hypothetical protein n=2 Tax=Tissierella TaxID=41273 RepID=UPI002804BD64|nr:hypothetical protein [uncultured Tissierella sp.]MDU5081698.1 hypothetical protein [Bacillota bacterium]
MKQQKEVNWTKLDNASKLFPAVANNKDTKVFRLACELYEDVDPKILQKSLDLTIESFPLYKSVLRRGAFWYYFESTDTNPKVELESNSLCAPLYIKNQRNLLIRVFYYRKRINVEIFHSLTDGAGVIWFMETLIYHYMTIRYGDIFGDRIPELNFKASISQKMDDSFGKNYNKEDNPSQKLKNKKEKKEKSRPAYHIKGNRIAENRMKLIEGSMSVKAVLDIAHEYNTTLTIFMTSLLLYSIYKEMPANKKKRPVVLSVPINLRQYYESATARNFFSTMNISYQFNNSSPDFEEIIQSVSESFKKGLTKEQLDKQLNHFMSLEKNLLTRVIPLPIKDYVLRIANRLNDRKITSSISNIGKIIMPSEFNNYIRQFSICVSARRPLITLCTYEDRIVISFTSPFEETDIQKTFFQFLSQKGVEIEITSNL